MKLGKTISDEITLPSNINQSWEKQLLVQLLSEPEQAN